MLQRSHASSEGALTPAVHLSTWQVQISQQLGEIESTFYKHPRSPHPDIFRVSNDENEGCTQVGRTGWHIDGTFQQMPFKYQTMHFHSQSQAPASFRTRSISDLHNYSSSKRYT